MSTLEIVRCLSDRFDAIVDMFKEYDFALQERRWFDWKHVANPFGSPQVYELRYEGQLAGTVALVTHPYHYAGRRLLGVQAVDGLMGRAIRGKHLFNDVMAFVVQVAPDEVHCQYFYTGFAILPGSMQALENAGWNRLAHFHVSKAVLGPGILRSSRLGRWLAVILAPLWPLVRTLYTTRTAGVVVRPVERFRDDMNSFQPEDRVHGDRSAAFPNWRVIDNPRDKMKAFTFHRGATLLGYAVCKHRASTWEVVELRVKDPGRACSAALLRHLLHVEQAGAVDFWMLDGFLQKDHLPRIMLNRGIGGAMFVFGTEAVGLPRDPRGWACSYLDSDW